MGINGKKIAALLTIMVLVDIYALAPIPSYMADRCLLSALTYHFFHGNIVHLLTNCFSFAIMMQSKRFNAKRLAVAYIIATAAYFTAPHPTIGLSNIIYALVGLMTPPLYHSWWRTPNTFCFLMIMIACLFIPHISAITHIVSFGVASLLSMAVHAIRQSKADYGKAKRRKC